VADESLSAIIGVYVDAEGVGAELQGVQQQVDRMVAGVNTKLEQLGQFTTLAGLSEGAGKGAVTLAALSEQAQIAVGQLRLLNEVQEQASAQGISLRVTGLDEIDRMRASLSELAAAQAKAAAEGGVGASNLRLTASNRIQNTDTGKLTSRADAEAMVAAEQQQVALARELTNQLFTEVGLYERLNSEAQQFARLQAQGVNTSGKTITQLNQEALAERDRLQREGAAFGQPGSGMRLGSVGSEYPTVDQFLDEDRFGPGGLLNPLSVKASSTSLRAAVAEGNYESDPGSLAKQARLLDSAAAAEKANTLLQQQGALIARINELEAAGVELTKAEVLARREAIAATALQEASQRGVSPDSAAGQRLLLQQQQAQRALADQLAKDAGGGGGFGGGFRAGLFGGASGGGAEELGNQVAQVAKYTALYQAFRLVEDAIKDALSETIEFERSVTNLQVQFGLTRDHARDLANQLGDIAAQNGLNPSQGAQLGQQFAGVFAGQGSTQDLAVQGATLGSQLAVVSGSKDIEKNFTNATAATRAFNLSADDTERVLDAATTAAEHFLGAADPSAILPGLAQIGDLAQAAGISLEQTANLLGDIQSRTGESSDAAAGELRRILGREGNTAFQQTFAREGINTTLPFQQELTQLSEKYDSLSEKEKAFITGQFGGGRAGAAATAFLEDYAKNQDLANKSIEEGGSFQAAYAARLNDIKGVLASVGGEFKDLAKDLGESGVFAGLGLAIEALKPALQLLDQIARAFDSIPAPVRNVAFAIGEVTLALRALSGAGAFGAIGRGVDSLANRIPGVNVGTPAVSAAARESAVAGQAAADTAFRDAQIRAAVAQEEYAAATAAAAAEIDATGVASAEAAAEAELTSEAFSAATAELTAATERLALAETELATTGKAGGASGLASVLGVAAIGAILVDSVLTSVREQLKAQRAADSLGITGNTADELRDSASKLNNAAEAVSRSSSGPIGSSTDFIRSHLGDATHVADGVIPGASFLSRQLGFGNGESTEDSARQARANAAIAADEAKRLDAVNAAASQGGNYAATIDLSAQNGITTSLQNLKASGLDANQQLDALHERLQSFATAAAGGADLLAKGQSTIISQQIANASYDKLRAYSQIDLDANNSAKGQGARFLKLDPGAVNSVINDASNAYFQSQGLDQGGAVSPEQAKALAEADRKALEDYLKKNGFSQKDIERIQGNLKLAIDTSVQQRIADANALAGQRLTPDQAGQVLNDVPALIQQAQQEDAARASLAGASGGVAGAQGALARAQQLYQDLKASGVDDQSLQPLKDQIDQLTLALQQATLAHIQAQGALTESLVSPFDKSGQIAAQISTLEQELATVTDEDQRAQIQTQINKLRQQQAQQAVADANSLLAVGITQADSVGQASVALQQAQNTLNAIVATGVTSGEDYNKAVQDVAQKTAALAAAQVSRASAQATSAIDPRDTAGLDQDAINKLQAQLTELDATGQRFGADGQQTQQYSDLVTQLNAAERKQINDQLDTAAAFTIAAVDPRDSIGVLFAQLAASNAKLQSDRPGTKAYADDYLKSVQLVQQIIQGQIGLANDVAVSRIDPRNNIALDQQAVTNDKTRLANDKPGTDQYALDLAKLRNDRQKEAEDLLAQAQAERTASARPGNSLAAAQAAIANARENIDLDLKGSTKYWQDMATLQAAKMELANQELEHANTLAQLSSDTTDPVAQALLAVKAAQNKLAADQANKTGDLDQDRLNIENAQQAAQKAAFDQQLQAQQTAYGLHEESGAQYLAFLNSQDASLRKQLSGMKKGQEGYQQLVDELNTVDQAIQDANQQLQGQFNLGDIKLPTVYDVRRQVAANQAGQAVDASQVHNVNVTINGADFQAVVNYINGVLGKSSPVVATTGRKGTN